jgi:hypothetical protein
LTVCPASLSKIAVESPTIPLPMIVMDLVIFNRKKDNWLQSKSNFLKIKHLEIIKIKK